MNITLVGGACIFLFVVLLVHSRFRLYALVTMPLFMILLMYFNYFGSYERMKLLLEVNVLLFFSFCLFLSGYSIGRHLRPRQIEHFYINLSNRVLTNDRVFISRRCVNAYFAVTVIYCIFNLWLNTQLYGSLENALIRFYGKAQADDFPSIFSTMQGFLNKALMAFVFVFRFYFNKYHQKSYMFYFTVLLLVLIAVPGGSRGAAVAPMVLLVVADCFSFTLLKGVSIRRRLKEYIFIVGFSLFLILSLSMIRNIDFDEIKDVYTAVSELNMGEAGESYSEGEGELILEDVQRCCLEFGNRVPFLSPFYTLETLVLAPIPRVLKPDKKVSFGYVLNEVKSGGSSLDPERLIYHGAVGWAAGLAGEGWANGGLFGVVFYALLFGLYSGFCANMYYRLLYHGTPLSLLFALLFFQMSYNFIRGDLLAGYAQGIYPLLIVTLLSCFIRHIRKYRIRFRHLGKA